MENKRKYPRLELELQVKHSSEKKSPTFGYTISKNISRSGMCIPTSSRSLSKGDIVSLDIKNKDDKSVVLTSGKIVWLRKNDRLAILDSEAGIEFIDLTPGDADMLIKQNA